MKRLMVLFLSIFLFGCKKNKVYEKNNDTIYFGYYPQTLEKDSKTLEKLNKNITTPTTDNFNSWSSYEYYSNSTKSNYMFYKDIDLNKDGINDYRGVYLLNYRPILTIDISSEYSSHQDNNGYVINNIYWFKYEKIKWNILKEKDGKALIVSDLVIDSMEYYPSISDRKFNHNGKDGYSNNYELSEIRKWLNDSFYNLAFNTKEKKIIEIMEADNTHTDFKSDNYSCPNTFDKVTLLSHSDVTSTYYKTDLDRQAKASDYALSLGAFIAPNGFVTYRLRTPSSYDPNNAYYIDYDGAVHGEGVATKGYVTNTDYGIRALITIKL